jgi:hypothetical protein
VRKRFFLWRRQRSRWLEWEWHNHGGVRYVNISLGHPRYHRWWAFSAYVYLTW